MRTVALDPGIHCGFAWSDDSQAIAARSGVFDASLRHYEGGGLRILRFEKFLNELFHCEQPKRVFFEAVVWRSQMIGKSKGDLGAGPVIYGELTGAIMRVCEERNIPFEGIPVSTIKKHATGKGNANKAAIVEAAQKKFGPEVTDDNRADALWILDYVLGSNF